MKSRSIITGLLICMSSLLLAQNSGQAEDHEAGHEHHRNEIGFGNSVVYFLDGQEWAYSLHFHYVRHIGESPFEAGLGYERIFTKPAHNAFTLELAYRPVEPLTIGIAPGIIIEDGHSDIHYALHFETAYEFEIGNFHVGPMVEVAVDREDIHLSLGLHAGIGF